jgi:Amt family ammonium transporter
MCFKCLKNIWRKSMYKNTSIRLSVWTAITTLLLTIGTVSAESIVDTGDTAWILISSALVLLMIPGVAFFYGGLVRGKNVLSTLMMVLGVLAVITLQWVLFGFSLAFGTDIGGFIGGLSHLGLSGIGLQPHSEYAATIPGLAFMIFQAMFAIITPTLFVSAFVERAKFSAFLLFAFLWSTLVYDPVAHWVWGSGGWLGNLGALDFAGGNVVHITSGMSALVIALYLGKRKGYGDIPMEPHNIPMAVLGAGLLWFGWFGFNGGSALSSGGLAANAFVNTHVSAASAALIWMLLAWKDRRPSALGLATGAVAGLVAITPAAGFVGPIAAIAIGTGAGVICYYALLFRINKGVDESLDAWAVHGVGGTWGALATGIFASLAVNPDGANGLLHGNPSLLLIQAASIIAVIVYTVTITLVVLKIVDATIGLRVRDEEEAVGLDISQHGERAYA